MSAEFEYWYEDEQYELSNIISIKRYNSCPHCNVVNQPMILGHIMHESIISGENEGSLSNVVKEENYEESTSEVENYRKELLGLLTYRTEVKTDILYQCTNLECSRIFIVHYVSDKNVLMSKIQDTKIYGCSPIPSIDTTYQDEINKVSSRFLEIYEQSKKAELAGLTDICGMGYRKALEFLIKDYVIYLNNDNDSFNRHEFLRKPIGQVISADIVNARLREISKRAVWLGNDETHYLRKWENKDVNDLKNMIDVVIHELRMELVYRKAINEMS